MLRQFYYGEDKRIAINIICDVCNARSPAIDCEYERKTQQDVEEQVLKWRWAIDDHIIDVHYCPSCITLPFIDSSAVVRS